MFISDFISHEIQFLQMLINWIILTSSAAIKWVYPESILYKSIAGRYRPVRVADGPITARCRFIKNASWVGTIELSSHSETMYSFYYIYIHIN